MMRRSVRSAGDLLWCRTLVVYVVIASFCTVHIHAFVLPIHTITLNARLPPQRPPPPPSWDRHLSSFHSSSPRQSAVSTAFSRTINPTTRFLLTPNNNNNKNSNNNVVTEQQAQRGINKVVQALRNDRAARTELGRLEQVTIVLGYGCPRPGTLAVRFNARFQKEGMGRSSVPLPFGLGQSNVSEGRGVMVGQVKASLDASTGKLTSCSVFRDLGYGRSFELKI